MGQRKIIDRLMTIPGVTEVRRLPSKARALNITVRDDGDEAWPEDDQDPDGGPVAVSSRGEFWRNRHRNRHRGPAGQRTRVESGGESGGFRPIVANSASREE
jgi:hypothetical protein